MADALTVLEEVVGGRVLAALPDLVLAFDAGRSTRPVVWANDALARSLGRSPVGEPLGAVIGSAASETIEAASGLRVGQCHTTAVELTFEGGADHAAASAFSGAARIVRLEDDVVVWIATDRGADLAANAELRRSNFDLNQFAFVASHDLLEPLRMVTAYLGLIDELYADSLDDKGRQYLDFAVDGATRMRALVHDLLDYARLNGGAPPAHRVVDLAAVVADALKGLEVAMADGRAACEVEGPLPAVLGDRSQLVRLLANLLSNAAKFGRDEAPARPILVRARRSGSAVRVEVVDDGIGIDPARRAEVFDLFRRLHPRTRYGGTGMGLAICKAIVTRHGGEIGIEEADNGGTVVWFTLPAAPESGNPERKHP